MDNGVATTSELIRKLSRRQWMVSLAVVVLALISLGLGWQLIATNDESAEIINLAGRQRMLSQRMAMFLALEMREPDPARRQTFRRSIAAAADDFDKAHERLIKAARTQGPHSTIHSLYFGPNGSVDAESMRFLTLARKTVAGTAPTTRVDATGTTAIFDAAGDGLIKQLDQATALFQNETELREARLLGLLQASTLLMVSLVAFGMLGVFRPVVRRLRQDVAARDSAERELKESENRLQAFSESSSDWFWQTDAQDRFSLIQDGRSVRAPLPFDKVQGRTRLELRPEIEKQSVEKWGAYQADVAARRPFRDLEYQVCTADGTLRWVSVSGLPYFDDGGQFLGYLGTAKYIQARKDIEASLLRLQLAIEQSPVSIIIIDARIRIIYVNAHFCTVSGYGAEEAIGKNPKKLLDSGNTPKSVFDSMNTTLAAGKNWVGEISCRRKNGELYWDRLSVSPMQDQQGRTSHFIAVSEDVTGQIRLRRREQDHNRILEAIANGTPLAETLTLIVAMAEAELSGSLCSLQRLNRMEGRLYTLCNSSLSDAVVAATDGLLIGPQVGSCGAAAFTATRVVVDDVATHPYWQQWRALAAAEGLRACWSQPILGSTGQVLGTLAIYYRTPRSPDADEIQVVELLSSLAAICLERDEAEDTLRQQQEQTRRLLAEHETVLNNALVGIVFLKHRRVVSCNRRIEEIFGYEPGELIGESSERFYASSRTFESIGKEAYRAVGESRNFSTELMLKHKDGSVFRGALTGRAIDPANPQEGSIWVYADITERYQAEQAAHKLLQAVEQSPVSIVITNRDGIIEYVNPRFAKVTGYSANEAVGQNPRFLQSGETPLATYKDLWQTLLACKEWRGILHNRRKSGELFWEEASISPIMDDLNQVTHFLAVKEDITERKKIEDELEQHRANLETLVEQRTVDLVAALEAAKVADQAKDAFLAHVSHELRTPLNAVIGLSELARRLSTDPRQQDFLDKVTGAGKSLAGIINDLLDLSKISAGRMEFENISFSLRGLIQRSLSVMAHRADEKGLVLQEHIDGAVPDVLLGDPLRIEQILLNLLSNAVKFTPAGRVELRIGLDTHTDSRVCLDILVEDTGIGLSEAGMARLFQPFAQADASMNRKFGGTGLGLVLCKRLAEMMDGDIGVSSREGIGTTFHVKLWLGLGNPLELENAARAGDGTAALPVRYTDSRVLVVDDQPLNREIVEALLSEVGIRPRVACNGQEALDIIKEAGPQGFDLVLMDIQMPLMDGLTATRTIRGWPDYSALPVVAMTAHTMEHEKDISTAAGMNDHIGKPFETTRFYQLLARWIPAAKQHMSADAPAVASVPAAPAATGLAQLHSIDTNAALARFGGNETRYRHWLTEFLREGPDYAPQIRRIYSTGDLEAARQAAHAIKGRVGMLGMSTLHPIAAALEDVLMNGALPDDLLERMQVMVDGLCREIRAALDLATSAATVIPAPTGRPPGPLPASLARLVDMLTTGDGESIQAFDACLVELQDTAWQPYLQQALASARVFDFDTARKLLAPEPPAAGKDKEA